jgi:hypothetical protein
MKKNFAWLLAALLVFLVVLPVAEDFSIIDAPVMRVAMFTSLLAIGVISLRGFGVLYVAGLALALLGITLNIAAVDSDSTYLGMASLASASLFVIVAIWATGRQIIPGDEINANRVVGAVNLYLLFGVLWAMVYALDEKLAPGSFAGLSEPLNQGWSSEWVYFSFVTMTTLGYGDITPVSATAKTLAYLQAVFSQFYLAILVAGLVGAYYARRLKS